jgi:hypothetical protein
MRTALRGPGGARSASRVLLRLARRARPLAAPALCRALSLSWAFWPTTDRPVVYAGPTTDLNGLAVLRRLHRLTDARPVLLTADPETVRRRLATYGDDASSFDMVHPDSL